MLKYNHTTVCINKKMYCNYELKITIDRKRQRKAKDGQFPDLFGKTLRTVRNIFQPKQLTANVLSAAQRLPLPCSSVLTFTHTTWPPLQEPEISTALTTSLLLTRNYIGTTSNNQC